MSFMMRVFAVLKNGRETKIRKDKKKSSFVNPRDKKKS